MDVHKRLRRALAVLVTLCATTVWAQTSARSIRASASATERQARAQWFLRGRNVAAAAAQRYRAYQQKMALRRAAPQVAVSPRDVVAGGWQPVGPAPLASDASGSGQQDYGWVSGRATAVAIDPADASGNTVFVGGAYGGLWKSQNAGSYSSDPTRVIWQPLIDDQASLAVGAIAIQPGNADPAQSVVLVGTGETNSSTDSYYGLGILRSQDGGNTWSPILQADATGKHSLLGLGFSQIAFSTATPNLVVAATAGTSEGELEGRQSAGTANLGLYSSVDGGASWTYGTPKDGAAVVPPGSATAVVYNAAAQEFFAVLRFHGFYASSDGLNWSRLASQPGSGLTTAACPASPSAACPIYRGELAVVPGRAGPQNLGEMYAWYVDANNNDQGIWKSVDGGASWQPIDETGIRQCGDLIGGCGTENGAYNLTLAAAPNGATGTDLYAGAVNLYKCTITSSHPACSPAGNPAPPPTATFRNLTHVYGCNPLGSIAHVHPSQHAMDFLPLNGGQQVVMYFANDGGIYRALDGYADLTSGTCGTPNQFDDLNETIGSLAQMVSLAQHPADANTMLGGMQGNGSAATAAGLANTIWSEVNGGDGGYSAINPQNPDEWFTSNTGVSIQSCELGIECRAADFNLVISSATLEGDGGPLYVPYLLDPQNPDELIAGTCRMWRGTTSGRGFTALSNNFETGSDAMCTGAEINTVRSIAAGGKTNGGLSNTIYAGTDGTGPLAAVPGGGRIWVTTNAAGGAGAWRDRTGPMNPKHFPIAAIALDSANANGNAAYAAVMGFGVGHVWKTSNGGQSWTNFSGTLPNAPVNALLVDSGMVYAGSDVGVFASNTSGASWAEVGATPVPGGGQSGFLPDVPVMGLGVFNNGTTKLLRAATYGRGVWQFALTTTPDFQMAFPDPSQTAFAGQTADFQGAVNLFNGYGSAITLNCATGGTPPPGTCVFAPPTLTPGTTGNNFTLTAGSSTVGDYSFQALGTGADGTPHAVALALHVVDFTLSALTPASVTVQPGLSSQPVAMQVGFEGSFPANGTVDLACAPQAGVTCSFSPGASVSPAGAGPVAVTMTVGTLSSMPEGNYSVTVTASSSLADPKTLSETLALAVELPKYELSANAAPITPVGTTASLQGLATTGNGYEDPVQLSCIAGSTPPPARCSFSPAAVIPSTAGQEFTLNLASDTAGNFSFNVQGVGSDGATAQTTSPVNLTVYDFSITPEGPSPPINPGQSAVYMLDLTPMPAGTNLPQSVGSFQCSGLPPLSGCTFSPNQVAAGSGITPVQLSITTTGPIARGRGEGARFHALWLLLAGMVFVLPMRRRRVGLSALMLWMLLGAACGGGLQGNGTGGGNGQAGTPKGTYTIQVTASEGTLQHPTSVTLTVQ